MLDCTYRVQIPHHPGQLARVAQAIADGEGLIGDVVTISLVASTRSGRSRLRCGTSPSPTGSPSWWAGSTM